MAKARNKDEPCNGMQGSFLHCLLELQVAVHGAREVIPQAGVITGQDTNSEEVKFSPLCAPASSIPGKNGPR